MTLRALRVGARQEKLSSRCTTLHLIRGKIAVRNKYQAIAQPPHAHLHARTYTHTHLQSFLMWCRKRSTWYGGETSRLPSSSSSRTWQVGFIIVLFITSRGPRQWTSLAPHMILFSAVTSDPSKAWNLKPWCGQDIQALILSGTCCSHMNRVEVWVYQTHPLVYTRGDSCNVHARGKRSIIKCTRMFNCNINITAENNNKFGKQQKVFSRDRNNQRFTLMMFFIIKWLSYHLVFKLLVFFLLNELFGGW